MLSASCLKSPCVWMRRNEYLRLHARLDCAAGAEAVSGMEDARLSWRGKRGSTSGNPCYSGEVLRRPNGRQLRGLWLKIEKSKLLLVIRTVQSLERYGAVIHLNLLACDKYTARPVTLDWAEVLGTSGCR